MNTHLFDCLPYVGHTLWYVPRESFRPMPRRGHEVTVSKVGIKWFYFGMNDAYRAKLVEGQYVVDGGESQMSPGELFRNEREWVAEDYRQHCWRRLRVALRDSPGPARTVSTDDIYAAAKLLATEISPTTNTVLPRSAPDPPPVRPRSA